MNRKIDTCLVERSHFETRGSECRKVRKPLMEKKRRARINQSLNDLKRLLMETGSVKKEGSRPSKLEKADVLELTVNYVQKLHKERLAVRGNLSEHPTTGSDTSPSPSGEPSNFKAGFKECARVVRQVLCHQQQETIEENLHTRVGWHLERCLAKIDSEHIQRKSPSLSLGSDSCSSFEENYLLTSSPELRSQRSSPTNHVLCASSSVSEESQDSCPRQSFSNEVNGFEFTSTPRPSPVTALSTDMYYASRRICGFKSVPNGSPDSMADKWHHNSNNQPIRHQIMSSSLPYESTGKANDVHNIDLWTCGFPGTSTSPCESSSTSLATYLNQQHCSPEIIRRHRINQYDDHISLSLQKHESEKSNVWRPW